MDFDMARKEYTGEKIIVAPKHRRQAGVCNTEF